MTSSWKRKFTFLIFRFSISLFMLFALMISNFHIRKSKMMRMRFSDSSKLSQRSEKAISAIFHISRNRESMTKVLIYLLSGVVLRFFESLFTMISLFVHIQWEKFKNQFRRIEVNFFWYSTKNLFPWTYQTIPNVLFYVHHCACVTNEILLLPKEKDRTTWSWWKLEAQKSIHTVKCCTM